jgi:hypothetical protein
MPKLQVLKLMESGTLNRSTSSTCSNEHSSRSHLIFQIFLSGQGDSSSQFSKISLIDLAGILFFFAGSERVGKSKVEDEKLKESIHINKVNLGRRGIWDHGDIGRNGRVIFG